MVDGEPISASLFDFGLYFFHNAKHCCKADRGRISICRRWRAISRRGSGTMSSSFAQDALGHPARHHPRHGADRDDPRRPSRWMRSSTSCATTRRAELRTLGLHLQLHQEVPNRPDFVLPDRAQVTMDQHFLASYVDC